ncbi:hypothetical protein E2C01_018778 [Portunus trituberculatus]|uniref:Uncharacterized protein n=1 Tax=Portunus trituberculatus TaxID=210409 RepID=A0A5B7DXF2_PORTR|nr:hypothetical protein [Portunus trituberculatus]
METDRDVITVPTPDTHPSRTGDLRQEMILRRVLTVEWRKEQSQHPQLSFQDSLPPPPSMATTTKAAPRLESTHVAWQAVTRPPTHM